MAVTVDQARETLRLASDLNNEINKRDSKEYLVGASASVVVSVAIVLIAMKKHPWWLKLVVFLLVSPILIVLFSAMVRASGVIKLSDEGEAARAKLKLSSENPSTDPITSASDSDENPPQVSQKKPLNPYADAGIYYDTTKYRSG